jgi:hypothetical protein
MKKRQFLMMTALICCLALVSCKKENVNGPNNSNDPTSGQTHVYVAGSTSSYGDYGPAVCWVDGTMQTLDANASDAALAVCVKGSDVYYGGSNGDHHPVIWKNSTPQVLSNDAGCVTNLKTANNKLYACGYVNNKPVYWVDGQMVQLPVNSGDEYAIIQAKAIFISGNDIYVAGTKYLSQSSGDGAYLWKNGVLQMLSDKPADACDVCVIGNTVYVVGSEEYQSPGYEGFQKSVMWVNGAIRDIQVNTSLGSKAIAVAELNGKPYVVLEGWVGDAWYGSYQGFAWYNEQVTNLSACQSPKDVFVHGSDVYIAGINNTNLRKAVVLKNLANVNLSTTTTYSAAYAVFVK